VGLAALAAPTIALIYQHGRFSAHDTHQTALALQAYAVGLAGYAAIKVMTPCFYALNLPRTPLRISLVAIGVNLALNILNMTVFGLGHAGLALATSCVAVVNFFQLWVALSRQVNIGGAGEWLGFGARVVAASALCGLVALGMYRLGELVAKGALGRALALFFAIGVATLCYGAVAWLLRIGETAEAVALVRRRFGGRRRRAESASS
jgi:putative peptidoglycan lipid II flippase